MTRGSVTGCATSQGCSSCDDKTLRLKANPQDPQDRYKVGAAWAAMLWDFRTSVGPGVADAVAFHALQFFVPKCTYETARQALHHADLALFPARRMDDTRPRSTRSSTDGWSDAGAGQGT